MGLIHLDLAGGLRAAGATGIVLQGRSPVPSCVVIADGRAWTEPAGELWGSETGPATDRLLERYGAGASVAARGWPRVVSWLR